MDTAKQKEWKQKKNMFYLLFYLFSYILPFTYFVIKMGVTKESTTVVMPVVFIGFIGILKLGMDIPSWVATWEPSLKKGLIKAIPKLLLFIVLMTLGLTLKYMLIKTIDVAFFTYFETVIVLFGGMAIGAIFGAYHLKYKEKYLMSKGYVLGTING